MEGDNITAVPHTTAADSKPDDGPSPGPSPDDGLGQDNDLEKGTRQEHGGKDDKANKRNSLNWTLFYSFFLKALGLWCAQRTLNVNGALPNGFPRIADFITSDPDHLATVYKRFDAYSCRNLLLLEARVAALGRFQDQLDKDHVKRLLDKGQNFDLTTTLESFEYFAVLAHQPKDSVTLPMDPVSPDNHVLAHCGTTDIPEFVIKAWKDVQEKDKRDTADDAGPDTMQIPTDYFLQRWEVAVALQKALKEYSMDPSRGLMIVANASPSLDEALVLQSKVLKLDRPTKRTTKALKEMMVGSLRYPLQFRETSAASKLLDVKEDLISLHPPGDDDNATKFVACLFNCCLQLVRLSISNLFEITELRTR